MSSLHSVPIKQRPPLTFRDRARTAAFVVVFGWQLVSLHLFQLVFLPCLLVPHPVAQDVYHHAISLCKEAFASVLILITHFFGPSRIVLTVDESVELGKIVQLDEKGRPRRLELAKQALWVSNHQAYSDWIFIWILLSIGSVSAGLVIILKASLEWAPVVGPAMQVFNFCFIDKKKTLAKSNLYRTAQNTIKRSQAYQLLLFPEGTLYSSLTRPKSAAYAKTLGIPDATNILLPRSAGLLFSLRLLTPLFPSLTLYDLTLGYTGVPAQRYAQDYYTLMSIFGRGIPPPSVHLHLRQIPLDTVPLGEVRASATPRHLENEITPKEKEVFEEWLRGRWSEKDRLMGEFGEKGEFPAGRQGKVEFALRMGKGDWALLGAVQVFLVVVFFVLRRVWRVVF
ncbi:hypothetical protein JCM8547_002052 [Rhodosporidiobolus lusitaniae]